MAMQLSVSNMIICQVTGKLDLHLSCLLPKEERGFSGSLHVSENVCVDV